MYRTFKSPYIKNPLQNLKERNLEKVRRLTKERRQSKSQMGATMPLAVINTSSDSSSDDADDP